MRGKSRGVVRGMVGKWVMPRVWLRLVYCMLFACYKTSRRGEEAYRS
jgi:hypothetical protein